MLKIHRIKNKNQKEKCFEKHSITNNNNSTKHTNNRAIVLTKNLGTSRNFKPHMKFESILTIC